MSPGTIIWAIIIVVIIVSRALRSARGDVGRQNAARADEGGFEAAPAEIEEFLRSLSTAAQRRAAGAEGVPGVGAGARPVPEHAPRASFWEGAPAVQPVPVVQAPPQPLPARTKARRKPAAGSKRPPPEVLAAKPPATVAPKERRGGAVPLLVLRGADLKRAVFWSEVLGPPVSLRRGRRLPFGPQP